MCTLPSLCSSDTDYLPCLEKLNNVKFSYAKSHLLKDDEVGKPSAPKGQVQLDSGAPGTLGAHPSKSTPWIFLD